MQSKILDHALKVHVFVCTNERPEGHPRGCCKNRGSASVLMELKKQAAASGLTQQIRIQQSGCLDRCEEGPVAVFYPQGQWYGHLTLQDVPELVKEISLLLDSKPTPKV
jgi:(2Fe-2S) ferredoxin